MSATQPNINEIFDFILDLTKKGGSVMREGFYGIQHVVQKNNNNWDLVTEYDTRVEDILINGILAKYPSHK